LNEIGVRWLAKEEQDKAEIACINIAVAAVFKERLHIFALGNCASVVANGVVSLCVIEGQN